MSRERRIAKVDAFRLFRGVERARDLETLCALARLEPDMVLETMHRRDQSEIRATIDIETRMFCNLGMEIWNRDDD